MIIDNANFVQIAIGSYDNPQCKTIEQFNEDVFKFSLLKKLMKSERYDGEHIQLILNTIVALYNVFDVQKCTIMMFFKVRREHWHKLKTYLVYLGNMPERIDELQIIDSEIPICTKTAKELRLI